MPREPVVPRAERDLEVDELSRGRELARQRIGLDGMRRRAADRDDGTCHERFRAEPGEGVRRTAAQCRHRIQASSHGDDVAQPALGVTEGQFVAVDGGEGLTVRHGTDGAADLGQAERADRAGDRGDAGSPESQDGSSDALEHRGVARIAHGTVRVVHGPAVRSPGCRDAECRVARAPGVLHEQLQRRADHLDGSSRAETQTICIRRGVLRRDARCVRRVVSVSARVTALQPSGLPHLREPHRRPGRQQRGRVPLDVPHHGIRASDELPSPGLSRG